MKSVNFLDEDPLLDYLKSDLDAVDTYSVILFTRIFIRDQTNTFFIKIIDWLYVIPG